MEVPMEAPWNLRASNVIPRSSMEVSLEVSWNHLGSTPEVRIEALCLHGSLMDALGFHGSPMEAPPKHHGSTVLPWKSQNPIDVSCKHPWRRSWKHRRPREDSASVVLPSCFDGG